MEALPIKIAIIVDASHIYQWQKKLIELLKKKENIQIFLVNLNGNDNFLIKIHYYWHCFLQFVDALLFKTPIDALEKHPLSFSDFSIHYLQANEVDLIWDFTGRLKATNPCLKSAKWGYWQLHYNNHTNCLSVANQALVTQQSLINISLCWYRQDNILQQKIATISVEGHSVNRTNNSYLWRLTYLLNEKLDILLFEHDNWTVKSNTLFAKERRFFLSIFIFYVYIGFIFNKLVKRYKKYYEQWALVIICPITKKIHEINLPQDRFWADPFIIKVNKKTYIFFEELWFNNNKGELKVAELSKELKLSKIKTVLTKKYHLSYPNVFLFEGNYYLLPETAENNTIELYKAVKFPHKWQLVHYIMQDVKAYDPTLIEYEGLWYLFVSMKSHVSCSSHDSLYIFYASSPLSQHWQVHRQNPVIVNAASARPAGNFFWKNNELYRPSQNCAGSYGKAININKVCMLSPVDYKEVLVKQHSTESNANLLGTHTWNQLGNIIVSDRLYKRVSYDF